MSIAVATATQESGYVFELLPDDRALVFRRADMDNPKAREALLILFAIWFQGELRHGDIDDVLDRAADCPHIMLQLCVEDGVIGVFRAEREPGKDSGDNPVITNIEAAMTH